MSGFEWIGNHYQVVGSGAVAATEAWWKRLRRFVERCKGRRIPRTGALDGPGAEIWALPSALAKFGAGVPRDANPA